MTNETNFLLPICDGDEMEIWIISSRVRVIDKMNEFCVKRIARDRVNFTPIVPVPRRIGRYMTILVE